MEWLKKPWVKLGIRISGFLFLIGATAFTIAYFTTDIPDPNDYVNSQSTIIQFSDGDEVGRIGAQNRTIVPLAGVPQDLRRAVLAAEDKGFYSQGAFNPLAILRGAINTALGRGLQGGSTITQQYAKTAFLTPDRTIQRKIIELIVAIKLENQLSKDQIFENYLNTIYFGRGSYGVMTASQQYFNRNVDQLTNAQAAVIASILRSPGLYDPAFKKGNEARLIARFEYVKAGMVDAGWLDTKDAAKMKFPPVAPRSTSGQLSGPKGHIIEAVQKELAKLGFSQEQLLVGGLVIKTTLDQQAQQSAVDAVNKFYPTKAPDNLHIGLVAIRPGTGEIVALYGGRDYLVRQLSDATQSIALAGSTFKPFAIVAALEQGIPLTSMWNGDSPQVFDDAGKPYEVSNYGDEGWGQVDLMYATKHSINTVFVPLGIKVGPTAVVDVARRAGIPESIAMMPTPSVVLGVASPHVIDVANAYATFAAQGIKSKPYLVAQVMGPNKGILYEAKAETQEVFSKEVMADLTYALKGTITGGTGAAALALGRPAAGKTGTSQSNASAWFSAFTPQLAASVALFRDSASESLNGIGGLTSVTGGTFPARIWTAFMKGALKGQEIMDFPAPSNIGGLDPVVITSGGVQTRKP